MGTALEEFGQTLVTGEIRQEAQGLRQAVDSGQLVMDPEAAERVAKIYEDKADKVQSLLGDVDFLIAHDAFGSCRIGQDLEQKFVLKAQGSGESAKDGIGPILVEAQKILRDMAQAYRDSARDMQNTDDENARNLERNL